MTLRKGLYGQTFEHVVANKVRSELAALDAAGVVSAGNAFSSILFVKGIPGPGDGVADARDLADVRDGAAATNAKTKAPGGFFCGPDGVALRAALAALGYAPEDWAALACWDSQGRPMEPQTLRRAITTIDPATLVACDVVAADLMRNVYAAELSALQNLEDALFAEGHVVRIAGMRALNLGGFEAALVDAHQKQVMWARLKLIPPLGDPY